VTAYLLVLIFPAGLLAAYGLFRWRYVVAVRRAMYSPGVPLADYVPRGPLDPTPSALSLKWIQTAAASERAPEALAAAAEITRDFRSRYVAAGAVYLIVAAILTSQGWLTLGPRAAISLAYANTLPSLFIMLAFYAGWRAWALAAALWAAAYLILLVGPLSVPWKTAVSAVSGGVDFTSYAVLALAPLVLRRTRPLLVGFVPTITLFLAVVALFAVVVDALGLDLETLQSGLSVKTVALSLAALVCGLVLSVWQIRSGPSWSFVLALAVTIACSALAGFVWRTLLSAFALSVALNAAFVLFVWYCFTWFLSLKARGWLPDEVLHFTFCWLALTALLPFYAQDTGSIRPLLPLAAYSFTLFVLLARMRRALLREARPPRRMLLLRVFSRSTMRARLLDMLDDSWRRVGRIDLVVGVDLAVRTLSAAALENFLLGRVRRQFLHRGSHIDHRLARMPSDLALDGRYPLNELHCLPDVWQQVVTALADGADVVLMDLRGFQTTNRGVVYELSVIVSRVPLARIVILTDDESDDRTLTEELLRAWSRLPADSPNADVREPAIELLKCSGVRSADAARIVERVFTAAAAA
jgi:hypothetical protein